MSTNNLVTPTVTGYSTFWGGDNKYAMLSRSVGAATALPMSGIARGAALVLGRTALKGFNKKIRQMVANGVSGNATATHKRVAAVSALSDPSVLGGARSIETISMYPGDADGVVAVTNADRDGIIDTLDRFVNPPIATYPTDASGNGGGGKLGR